MVISRGSGDLVDRFVARDIEQLRPAGEMSDTPEGRMRAIDLDKSKLYEEMHQLLAAGPSGPDREAKETFEGQLREILDVLIDLDHRQLEAFNDCF